MALTDIKCKNAKPMDKQYKLSHEKGLYLLVHPNGSKYWRLKYRIAGKEKTLSLGVYPDVTLKEADGKSSDARKEITKGSDPSLARRLEKSSKRDNTFRAIADEWFDKKIAGKSESHRKDMTNVIEKHLNPWIGDRPIADIKPAELLSVIRVIEGKGTTPTAYKALATCGRILRYAIATHRAENDFTQALREALGDRPAAKNYAAITDPNELKEFLKAMHGYRGTFTVNNALRILPLLMCRPGELRLMEWSQIDFDAREWRYMVTKTEAQHIVPLSRQALTILRDMQRLTGNCRYVFAGARTNSETISSATLHSAIGNIGYRGLVTPHGFSRATARTILDELLGFRPDIIEHQLAHAVKDPNGRAYNRTAHLVERHTMMQAWADYLDNLRDDGNVVALKRKVG